MQVFDCRLHGCSQDLVFPVSSICWLFFMKLSAYLLTQYITRLRSNLHGFLLLPKMHLVGQIVFNWYALVFFSEFFYNFFVKIYNSCSNVSYFRYLNQKDLPKLPLLPRLKLKRNALVVLYLGRSLLLESG